MKVYKTRFHVMRNSVKKRTALTFKASHSE